MYFTVYILVYIQTENVILKWSESDEEAEQLGEKKLKGKIK